MSRSIGDRTQLSFGTRNARHLYRALGIKLPFPIISASVGVQGSMHAQKELPTVKGAGAVGTLYVASSVTQLSLEDIAAATSGTKWFQPYIPASRPFAMEMLQRAKAAGYKAIVLTVDATVTSNRERSTRLIGLPIPNLALGNVPKTSGVTGNAMAMKAELSWDDVAFCREQTGLPVIVKGILSAAQALEAQRRGCAAVWLSNHGGRQLGNVPSAMTVLPRSRDVCRSSWTAGSIAVRACSALLRSALPTWHSDGPCSMARRSAACRASTSI
ncbi:MAG: alpha-hydroxy-acid oxidizing protein [Bradyrhizobium sp.]|nr:alpha-hydroxy-acid oxidizing protein [Bradyrhizobium sp.]